jgi:helix-turn-helix protein
MSDLAIIPIAAVSDRRLTGADIRTLCALGSHTDKQGRGAWASARKLAQEAGTTRATFFESVRRLIECGYVRRTSRAGRTSVYDISLPARDGTRTRPAAQDTPCLAAQDTTRPAAQDTNVVRNVERNVLHGAAHPQRTANRARQENYSPMGEEPAAHELASAEVAVAAIARVRAALGPRAAPDVAVLL